MLMDEIRDFRARVGVIGLGYVGLPLAVTAAKRGFKVVGFDIDQSKMDRLEARDSYIGAVSSQDLVQVADSGNLNWTTDFSGLAACQVIIICVPTPLTKQREPDLSYVEDTCQQIARYMTKGTLVVLESTTFPGTTDEVLASIFNDAGHSVGTDVFLGFSPEREDPGNANFNTRSIPKIVAGHGECAGDLVESLYTNIVDEVVRVSTTRTAEAVKITENIFRSVNIALVNELKLIYDRMDIDVWEVIDGAATKPFGYMPFYPGPGLGGHCIPIDPFYLTWKAREYELPTRFIELAGEINTNMPQHVVDRLREIVDRETGKGLTRARILLVGVSYKKNVSDMRESPSMKLLELLEAAGSKVDYIDPHVSKIPPMREYNQFAERAAIDPGSIKPGDFDAVLIATDHDDTDYASLARLGCPVIDTRNAMERRGLPSDGVFKV